MHRLLHNIISGLHRLYFLMSLYSFISLDCCECFAGSRQSNDLIGSHMSRFSLPKSPRGRLIYSVYNCTRAVLACFKTNHVHIQKLIHKPAPLLSIFSLKLQRTEEFEIAGVSDVTNYRLTN